MASFKNKEYSGRRVVIEISQDEDNDKSSTRRDRPRSYDRDNRNSSPNRRFNNDNNQKSDRPYKKTEKKDYRKRND
jgi:hypothetical protein